jgi:hypothetical protein
LVPNLQAVGDGVMDFVSIVGDLMVEFTTVGAVWPLVWVDLTVCRVVGWEGTPGFLFVDTVLGLAVLVALTGSLLLPGMTDDLESSGLYDVTPT